jgi:uncharacterized protein (AIM24 family)
MTCQNCGKPVAEGARFCASCGTPCGTPVSASAESHPTEFHIVGDVMQAVVIPLRGGQGVQAEPGALLYMAGDVEMDSQMKGGLWGGIRRMVAGESLFMTRFRSRVNGQVAFAAPYPGKIKELTLAGSTAWLCQPTRSCARPDIEVGIAFTKRLGAAAAPPSSTAAATSSSSTSSRGRCCAWTQGASWPSRRR